MMKNNSTTIATPIINQGDFGLKYSSHHDSYLLFYENSPILEGYLEQLFERKLIYQIFEFEPDSKKAAEFIIELYKWGITQHEAFEKILENFSATEILMILRTGQLNNIK